MKLFAATRLTLALISTLGGYAKAHPTNELAIQAGYHVIFSYPGLTPPDHLFDLIRQGKVGGIILFGENVGDGLEATIDSFQKAYSESKQSKGHPLLIMTDQEGGKVRRLPGGPNQSEKQVGLSPDPVQAATQAGKDASAALESYHCNCNLAPVLDVFREAGNFIDQFGRSFSNNSDVVADCGSAFIRSQQSTGIVATAKHFPGLGAATTNDNTDLKPVTIDLSVEQLRSVDEAPYKDAIDADVDMVMASWAVYPAVDSKLPAGLSEIWIQRELRGRLCYRGVTITDALEAGALAAFGDAGPRGVLAAQAGMDILLASERNVTQGEAVVDALVAAVRSGKVDRGQFEQSTHRIRNLRRKLAF